jgi:hypothetical protein
MKNVYMVTTQADVMRTVANIMILVNFIVNKRILIFKDFIILRFKGI